MTEKKSKDENLKEEKTEETEEKDFINNKTMIDTFNNAINGLINAVSTERNMKIHLIAAILVVTLTLFLDFTKVELAIITITIMLVFMAEIFNTAIEEVADMVTKGQYSKYAKKAKDISAGAVFLTAINAVFVGYLLIYNKLEDLWTSNQSAFYRIFNSSHHLTFVAVALVLIITLFLKGIFYKENTTPLQGGAISGHTALAFTLATIGAFLTKKYHLIVLFFLLAIIVAESRVEAKIHSVKEVVLGALLGMAIAALLFVRFL